MSQDRVHIISDNSQHTLLKALIKYCEQNARDLEIIEQLKEGVCGGLTALDAYANFVSELKEKSDLPLPKDDLLWLNNIKDKLSTWKLNQPFPSDPEDPFIQDIERFLAQIISLGNYVYRPLTFINWDFETLLLDTHNRTFKSVLRLAEPINYHELSEQVDKLVTEDTWTSVIAGRHQSSLFLKNGSFFYYDPNSSSHKKEYKNQPDEKLTLARHVFLKHFKYNLQKSSQFVFNSYRFGKLSEDKVETKLTKSETKECLELTLLNHLYFDKTDDKSNIINEKAARWNNLTILVHAIHNKIPLPVIQHYLDNGADPNIDDESKFTSLHNLLFFDNDQYKLELLAMLLKAGANPKAKSKNLLTPVSLAFVNAAVFHQNENYIDPANKKAEMEVINAILALFKVDRKVIEDFKLKENHEQFLKINNILNGLSGFLTAHKNTITENSKLQIIMEMIVNELEVFYLRGEFSRAYEYIQRQTITLLSKASENGMTLLAFAIADNAKAVLELLFTELKNRLRIDPEKFDAIANQFTNIASGLFKISTSYPADQQQRIRDYLHKNICIVFESDPELALRQLKEQCQTTFNVPNSSGMLPLTWAARAGNYAYIEGLLKGPNLKIDINQSDVNKKTALYYAVLRQDEKLIELLLSHGAKISTDFQCSPLLQALRVKEFIFAKKLTSRINTEAIQSNFIAFKRFDRLAQRLYAAIGMYNDQLILENVERKAACDKIFSAVNTAYHSLLIMGDGNKAYHQLLFGEEKGVVAIINDIIKSHRSSRFQGLLFQVYKQTPSRLETELELALVESGLQLHKNSQGIIVEVEPTVEERAIQCLAHVKQKINTLNGEEYKAAESSFLSKIHCVLNQYGFSSPVKTLDMISELMKPIISDSLIEKSFRQTLELELDDIHKTISESDSKSKLML